MKWNKLDWLAILALGLVPLVFFAPVVFQGRTFFFHDISIAYVPLNAFNTRTLQAGELPLWNPYLDGGFPLAGLPESAPFYLLNLILLLPLPITTTQTWYLVVHYILAGVFTYLLTRCGLHLGRAPSLIAGLTFALSGTMIAQLTNFALVTTWIWMPLILFFFIRALETSKVGYAVLAGVAMAVQISKSHTQMVLYTVGILGLYALFAFVAGYRDRKGTRTLMPFGHLTVVLLVGVGLSAFQLFYTAELIRRSDRSAGLTFATMTALSYPPLYFLKFLVPGFLGSFQNYVGEGNFTELHAYAGILPLLLTPFAFLKRRHWRVWFFTTLLILCVVLSLGRYMPLYRGLIYLPIFNFFRVPARWLFPATFSISVLAAYGAHNLMVADRGAQTSGRRSETDAGTPVVSYLAGGLVLVGAVGLLWLCNSTADAATSKVNSVFDKPSWVALHYGLAEHNPDKRAYLVIEGVAENSYQVERQREEEAFRQRVPRAYTDAQRSLLHFLLILTLGLVLVLARRQGLIDSWAFGGLSILLVLFDVLTYGGIAYNPTTDESYFLERPDTVEFLVQAEPGDPYRVFPTNQWIPYPDNVDYVLSTLAFNIPSLYEIESITGEGTLPLKRHTDYMKQAIGPAGEAGGMQMLSIANVKYVISEWNLENNPGLKLVFTGDRQKVFENLGVLPRAFAVHRAEVVDDDAAMLERLGAPAFDPQSTVLLEEQPARPLPSRFPDTPSTVRITHYKHNRVTLGVDMADNGFVVLSDVYYPGWNAYVDDQASPVYRANYQFRAVEVGPGEHRVEYLYQPRSFWIGVGVTALTALVLVVWAVFKGVRRYGNRSGSKAETSP